MITEVCLYLKNWFNANQPKFIGKFTIKDGVLKYTPNKLQGEDDMVIAENQYYRIIGSVFNDGVYKHGSEELTDEAFEGAVWLMAVPKSFLDIIAEIEAWQAKYGDLNSPAMSPYSSESFGGYSYSKSNGGGAGVSSSTPTWQSVFRDRLWRYKKI